MPDFEDDTTTTSLIIVIFLSTLAAAVYYIATSYHSSPRLIPENLPNQPNQPGQLGGIDLQSDVSSKKTFYLLGEGFSKNVLDDVMAGSKLSPEDFETLDEEFEVCSRNSMSEVTYTNAKITVSIYSPQPEADPSKAINIPCKAIIKIDPSISSIVSDYFWDNLFGTKNRPSKIQTKSDSSSPDGTSKSIDGLNCVSSYTEDCFIGLKMRFEEKIVGGYITKFKAHIFPNLFYIVNKALESVKVDIPPASSEDLTCLKIGRIDNIRYEDSNSFVTAQLHQLDEVWTVALVTISPSLEQLFNKTYKSSLPGGQDLSGSDTKVSRRSPKKVRSPTPRKTRSSSPRRSRKATVNKFEKEFSDISVKESGEKLFQLELALAGQIQPTDMREMLSRTRLSVKMKTVIILVRRGGDGPGNRFYSSYIKWKWYPPIDSVINNAADKARNKSPVRSSRSQGGDGSATYLHYMMQRDWLEDDTGEYLLDPKRFSIDPDF